ncbi:glutathione ABC transporter ATP-binding protein GsiA, partial [Burkholderia multivorans]
HDMGVVAEVADRVLVMYRGEKVEEGASERIFATPAHRYTRALLAAVPRLGSMHGTDVPEKFPLLNADATAPAAASATVAPAANDDADEARDTPAGARTDTQPRVDPAAPPILRVRDLVT